MRAASRYAHTAPAARGEPHDEAGKARAKGGAPHDEAGKAEAKANALLVLKRLPCSIQLFFRLSRLLRPPDDCGRVFLQALLLYAIIIYRVPGVSGWMFKVNNQSPSVQWQGDPAHLFVAENSSKIEIHNPQLSGEISYLTTALSGIGFMICLPMAGRSVYRYFADGGVDFAAHVTRSGYPVGRVKSRLVRLSVPMVAIWATFCVMLGIYSTQGLVQKLRVSTLYEVPSWYNVYVVLEYTSAWGLLISMPGIVFPVPIYFYVITRSAVENVRTTRLALERIIFGLEEENDAGQIMTELPKKTIKTADAVAAVLKHHSSAMRYANKDFAQVSGWACAACVVWFVEVNYIIFGYVLWGERSRNGLWLSIIMLFVWAGILLSIFSMCTLPSSEFERLIVQWLHEPDVLRRLSMRAFPGAGELTLFIHGVKEHQLARFSLKIFGVVMTSRLYVSLASTMLSIVGIGIATFLRGAS